MADYTFVEGEAGEGEIKVAQSTLHKKLNESAYVKFSIKYVGTMTLNQTGEYVDLGGNTILEGQIKTLRELANNPVTNTKIYEVTLYDNGYKLKEGNTNEIFREMLVEDIIESIVESNELTFVNLLTSASDVTIDRTYRDLDPIEAVNELCNVLGANWRVQGDNFYLYKQGQLNCPIAIDGRAEWGIPEGWIDDSSKQVTKAIVKGKTIRQRDTKTLTGTGTVFFTERTPENVYIEGMTQTTDTIDGDYVVDKANKKITFDASQVDPEISYEYDSQIRVEVGTGKIQKEFVKDYLETPLEARKLGRKILAVYADGVQSGSWQTNKLLDYDVRDINPGDLITVFNKLNTNRNGSYIVTQVDRNYPRRLIVQVGEDVLSIYDWQAESKERLKQLERKEENQDFTQTDLFSQGNVEVRATLELTHFFAVFDTGEVLFASETEMDSEGDIISDDGDDEDFPLAYDNDAEFPEGTFQDYL
jgi:hypothetical protein